MAITLEELIAIRDARQAHVDRIERLAASLPRLRLDVAALTRACEMLAGEDEPDGGTSHGR